NQFQRVAVDVITLADLPLGRIPLALLLDLCQGKDLLGFQQIGLLPPGEQAAGCTAGGVQQQQDKRQGASITKRQCRLLQTRSEEHTSELQSREHLVCRILLEKKNT